MRCPDCAHERVGRWCGRCGALVAVDGAAGDATRRAPAGWSRAAAALAAVLAAWLVLTAVDLGSVLPRPPAAGTPEPWVTLPSAGTTGGAERAVYGSTARVAGGELPDTTSVATQLGGDVGQLLLVADDTGTVLGLLPDGGQVGALRWPVVPGGAGVLRLGGAVVAATPHGPTRLATPGSTAEPLDVHGRLVAAGSRGAVWSVAGPGAPEGPGPSTARLLGADGEVRAVLRTDRPVLRGVAGGLAVVGPAGGVEVLDPRGGRVVARLGDGPVAVADAAAGRTAWCELPCERLVISDAAGATVTTVDEGAGGRLDPAASWLSPDGRWLATVALPAPLGGLARELRVHELPSGRVVVRDPVLQGGAVGTWTDDGGQLLVWLQRPDDAGGPRQQLRRWRSGADTVDVARLRLLRGPPAGLVAVPAAAAPALLSADGPWPGGG